MINIVDDKANESNIVVEASNEKDACAQIRKQGFYILSIKKSLRKSSYWKNFLSTQFQKSHLFGVSLKNLFLFTRQLSLLLNAGLPLVRCLRVLKEQKESFLRVEVIESLEADILSGKKFSDSLSAYPSIFKKLYVSMVYSGEVGGQLNLVLTHLSEFFEHRYLIRKRLINSLFYPCIILISVVCVIMILLLFVIPKFQTIFIDLHIDLPYPTRILLAVSSFIKKYFIFMFLLGGGLWILGWSLFSFEKLKNFFDRFLLKIPFWGSVYQKMELLRFTQLMGMLLSNGVPILQSFDISKSVATSQTFCKALNHIQFEVRDGGTLAEAFGKHPIFTSMIVNMVDIGEQAGSLDKMFVKTALFYEEEIKNTLEVIVKLIEPLLILLLALVVAFIVMSMFLPMVTMLSAIGR